MTIKTSPSRGRHVRPSTERKIAELYREGANAHEIARFLKRRHYKTARGGVWAASTVVRVLKRLCIYEGRRPRDIESQFESLTRREPSPAPRVPGCLVWLGGVNSTGRGRITDQNGKLVYVHRYAYEQKYGAGSLRGRDLHHVCANPLCAEPTHLLPVESKEVHARVERLERGLKAYMESEAFLAEMDALKSPAVAGAAC